MKNVFKQFPFSKRYYLMHPWKFLCDVWTNLCNAWQRATKGYCSTDVINFNDWFLEIAPDMLRELSDGHSYPGNKEFDTYEKWQDWLYKQADNLLACRKESLEEQNEYKEEYIKTLDKIEYEKLENGFVQVKFDDSSEAIAIHEKYLKRDEELYKERQERLQFTLNELGRNWFHLWD